MKLFFIMTLLHTCIHNYVIYHIIGAELITHEGYSFKNMSARCRSKQQNSWEGVSEAHLWLCYKDTLLEGT